MNLRCYQQEAVARIFDAWGTAQSTLAVMATGTGKTILLAEVIRQRPSGRAILLAHREELIWQGASKIEAVTGVKPDIEMAEYRARDGLFSRCEVVISTIQTQGSGQDGEGRMTRFDPMDFSLLIIDEAHHAVAVSYRKVIDYYRQNPNLKVLGVTATPDRTDEQALGQIFQSVAFDYELVDAISDGFLVPVRQTAIEIDGLDYSSVHTTAGDLNGADLARVLQYEEPLQEMLQAMLECAMGMEPGTLDPLTGIKDEQLFRARFDPILQAHRPRKTLVFAASVAHGERLAQIINRWIPSAARFVHGKTDKDERRIMLADYAAKAFPFLVNVGIATEGFDDPGIELVAMCRPTKSRALYAQMAGRGTRPLPGIVDHWNDAGLYLPQEAAAHRRAAIAGSDKPFIEIIDFVGNAGRHKLITTADILGGKFADEVIAKAKSKAQSAGGPVDMKETLEEAQRELAEEREIAQRAKLRIKSLYSKRSVDPFAVLHVEPYQEKGWNKGQPPSAAQLACLEKFGVPTGQVTTRTQASQLLDALITRRTQQRCTFKQAQKLTQYGYSPDASFDQACQIMDALAANGWRRPDGSANQPVPATPRREVTVY